MIVGFSRRKIMRLSQLYIKLLLLIIIMFYILPKLLSLFLNSNVPAPKLREDQLLEKPLRVISIFVNNI